MSKGSDILVSDFSLTLVPEENITQLQEVCDLKSQLEAHERVYVSKMYAKYKSSRKMAEVMKVSHSKANYLINKYCRSAGD